MRMPRGCGWVILFLMFVIVGCLVFVSLAAGLFATGELPLYEPRLTGLQPHPNFAFLPSTPITLTFDQPMKAASVEAAFFLEPDVAGTFEWNEDLSQVVFTPEGEGFKPGTSYSARLEAGAEAGTFPRRTARSVEWSFSLPPLLDTVEPPLGAEDLGPRSELKATFHYPLDCTATFRTFSIAPDTVGLLGCKDNTLTFEPAHSLEAGTHYMAALDHVFLEGDATPRPGVEWEFHTAPPLTVDKVLPEEAGFLTDLWTSFTVSFNRPVQPESAVSRFSLAAAGGLPVEGEFSWQQDGAVLVFRPNEPLKPALEYQLVLESGVEDILGYKLQESRRLSYSTPVMMGLPMPVPGSRGVALDSTIRVPFARPMDKESVEAGLVISPALEGDVVWEEDTLLFIPRGGLAPQTVYQLSVQADIRDATGAPLAQSRQWAFETEPFLVGVVAPSDTVVTELRQPISFTFALPMDRASIQAGLTISPSTPGDLVWSDEDRRVTFVPGPAWLAGADYEISIAGSVRTADGYQTLGDDLGYTFSTGVADVRFGEGPNVQVVVASGERAVQVLAKGADVADFHLYAITETQFLELYDLGYDGAAVRTPEPVATVEMTPTISWREPLTGFGDQASGDWQPSEVHIPADVPPGLYVLAAEPPSELQGQLLVVLTDHVLVVKRALAVTGSGTEAEIVAWDTAIRESNPVVSATMRFYDSDAALTAEGVTDGDGLVTLSVPGDPGPSLVFSEKDGDVTVAGLEREWSEEESRRASSPESRSEYRIYTFTDQPIYRPAGTIHFKQFVRADDDVRYMLPAPGLPITVHLRDPRDNIAASQVLTSTEFGTAYGSFKLTDRPLLGRWSLETEVEGTVTRTPIEIADLPSGPLDVELWVPQGAHADESGRPVEVARRTWSQEAADQALWQRAQEGEESRLSVDMDRQAYDAGQDAQIVVSTPVSGTALISFERGRIHHVETLDLVSGTNPISVPVQVDYAPNVELVVHQYGPSDGQYETTQSQPDFKLHSGRAQLLVPMDDRMLTLSVSTEQEVYGPGEEAVFQLRATDHLGEPVEAEISLALVDEDLFALAAHQVPDPFDAFYGPRPNLVRTYDSMRPTRWLSSEDRGVESVGVEEEGTPPEAFHDTAVWVPAMITDRQGEAELAVQMPDSLTTWRAIARAITTDTQVGEATLQLVVAQNIAIRPEVPEFLIYGDTFSVTAAVHNFTSQPVSATVEMEQEGLEVSGDGRQILHLPAEGTATALWPAVAEGPGEARIMLRVTGSRGARLIGRDVADVSLQIHPLALPASVTWAGELTPDNPAETISLTVPADMITPSARLEISMAPSAVPVLFEGVSYLVEYPYDCVEQTVGRVLAGAVVADGFDESYERALLQEADLAEMVQLSLQKLYGYENEQGGWGWWADEDSDIYQTAYTLYGLAMTREAGFAVDEGVVERGVEALKLMLEGANPQAQAYGGYALVMIGEPMTLTLTLTDALQMDPFSQAALAIAIEVADEGDLALGLSREMGPALLDSLEESAIEDATTAHWEEGGTGVEAAQVAMGSPERTTALVVQALVRLDPENALLSKAVRWLMSQRQGQGWGDTQRTSYVVLALADYVRSVETAALATGFQVILNGELWAEGQMEPLQAQEVVTVPLSALAPGEHELQVILGPEGTAPSGRLYYAATAIWQVAPTEGAFAAAQGQEPGIGVRRAYQLQGSEEPVTGFQPGDLVEVVITLDVPEESWYIVIEDPLPAGFEALDEQPGVGEGGVGESGEPVTGVAEGYDHKDVRAGGVTFFLEQVGAGSQTITYLVRAVRTGSFAALPTVVYPMYDSGAWSRSASARLELGVR